MLLQKRTDTRVAGICSMLKSIYLFTTTPTSHTHRFYPLPLATPASYSPHQLATLINSTHSPQLSSILLTCTKFNYIRSVVDEYNPPCVIKSVFASANVFKTLLSDIAAQKMDISWRTRYARQEIDKHT